jgi:hypothetical protein
MSATGDNDKMFMNILKNCILHKRAKMCDDALKTASSSAEKIPATLEPLYKTIHTKSKQANKTTTIIHAGYVRMYNVQAPKDQCPSKKVGTDVTWATVGKGGYRERINDIVTKVNSKIKESAEKAGVVHVDVDPYFEGHRFCDGPSNSWMQHALHLRENGILCHPTWEGHSAYVNATLKALAQHFGHRI